MAKSQEADGAVRTGRVVVGLIEAPDLDLHRPRHALWSGHAPTPLAAELIQLATAHPDPDRPGRRGRLAEQPRCPDCHHSRVVSGGEQCGALMSGPLIDTGLAPIAVRGAGFRADELAPVSQELDGRLHPRVGAGAPPLQRQSDVADRGRPADPVDRFEDLAVKFGVPGSVTGRPAGGPEPAPARRMRAARRARAGTTDPSRR